LSSAYARGGVEDGGREYTDGQCNVCFGA